MELAPVNTIPLPDTIIIGTKLRFWRHTSGSGQIQLVLVFSVQQKLVLSPASLETTVNIKSPPSRHKSQVFYMFWLQFVGFRNENAKNTLNRSENAVFRNENSEYKFCVIWVKLARLVEYASLNIIPPPRHSITGTKLAFCSNLRLIIFWFWTE